MINIIKNLKKNLFIINKRRNLIDATNLERKAIQLNLRSEECLELAKKSSQDWKEKWMKKIS
tara:strand:- start:316 stop:501 length:186 start_codon:yes stop_codon:yes gene_type:complete